MKAKTVVVVAAVVFLCLLTAYGVRITGLTLPETLALETGKSQTLVLGYTTGKTTPRKELAQAARTLDLVWTSSNEAVATVDARGVVTAVGQGECTITVQGMSLGSQVRARTKVTVSAPASSPAPAAPAKPAKPAPAPAPAKPKPAGPGALSF